MSLETPTLETPTLETPVEAPVPFDRQLKILSPPKNAGPIRKALFCFLLTVYTHSVILAELPESAYKLDPNEIKKLYQSTVERRQNLENK